MKKLNTDDFVRNAKLVHGNKYDYSQSVYDGSKAQVKIICNIHGAFFQTPNNHLRSGGCNACGYEKVSKKLAKQNSDFIKEAFKVHGDKYDYSNVEYVRAHSRVSITCKQHGEFMQTPHSHLKGSGCVECSEYTFKSSLPALIYVLRANGAFKIGVTNNITQRIYALTTTTPFKFELVKTFPCKGSIALEVEKHLHSIFESIGFKTFKGCTEWFKINEGYMQDIENNIKEMGK